MIADLRALITDLRPAALDALGVKAAIEALADRNEREGLEIDVSVELAFEEGRERTRLVDELETALYRIAQEALTNAIKHGHATRIVIEVHEDPQTVYLRVRDNGKGYDPELPTSGFGLLGMRERAELFNGELGIDSAPGSGTTVTVRLPISRRAEESTGAPAAEPGQFSRRDERRAAT